MRRLQVGSVASRWFVSCELALVPQTESSSRPESSGVPVIEVGDAEYGAAEAWVVTLCDAATRSPVLQVKLTAAISGVSPKCLFESDRAYIVVDSTVLSLDLLAMGVDWKREFPTPLMDCWVTPHGLLTLGEGDLAMLDEGGRSVWERSTDDLVVDFVRSPPVLRLTLENGDLLEIEEETGSV